MKLEFFPPEFLSGDPLVTVVVVDDCVDEVLSVDRSSLALYYISIVIHHVDACEINEHETGSVKWQLRQQGRTYQ